MTAVGHVAAAFSSTTALSSSSSSSARARPARAVIASSRHRRRREYVRSLPRTPMDPTRPQERRGAAPVLRATKKDDEVSG